MSNFHGEDGSGMGASHQTGWTALVAKLLQQSGTAEDPGANVRSPADVLQETRIAGKKGGERMVLAS